MLAVMTPRIAPAQSIAVKSNVLDCGERSGSTEIVLGEMGLHPEKTSYECFIEKSHSNYVGPTQLGISFIYFIQ